MAKQMELFKGESLKLSTPLPKRKKFDLDRGIEDLVGSLCDPIIVHGNAWGTPDMIPEWLRHRITLDRMIELMLANKEGRDPIGTDSEALAYMIPLCMEHVPDHDWLQIYLYLGSKVMGAEGKVIPEDIKVDHLTIDQDRDLRRLKEWIYTTRRRHRTEKAADMREERKEAAAQESREKYGDQSAMNM